MLAEPPISTEPESRPPQIYRLMASIMQEIPSISKGRTAKFGEQYAYRGIDDVYQALGPVMAKHGVFCRPHVLAQTYDVVENRSKQLEQRAIVHLELSFTAPDGSHIEADFPGVGIDQRDKAVNKAASVAMREILIKTFCIPLAGSEDSETDNTPVDPTPANGNGRQAPQQPRQQQQQQAAPQQAQQPRNVETLADGKLRGLFQIASVSIAKQGVAKTGRPWTKFAVTATTGEVFETFSASDKDKAEHSIGAGSVVIVYTQGQYGYTLEAIDVPGIGEEPQAAPSQPQQPAAPAPQSKCDIVISGKSTRTVNTATGQPMTIWDIQSNLGMFVCGLPAIGNLLPVGVPIEVVTHETPNGKMHIDSYTLIPQDVAKADGIVNGPASSDADIPF
jgi:hypothetical protein